MLYWLNYQGRRIYYSSIAPGREVEQSTFATHPWLITNRHGECVEIFVPTGRSGHVALD